MRWCSKNDKYQVWFCPNAARVAPKQAQIRSLHTVTSIASIECLQDGIGIGDWGGIDSGALVLLSAVLPGSELLRRLRDLIFWPYQPGLKDSCSPRIMHQYIWIWSESFMIECSEQSISLTTISRVKSITQANTINRANTMTSVFFGDGGAGGEEESHLLGVRILCVS